MATHSSILAWRIPGTEEPSGLLSLGSHRVGHDWSDLAAAGLSKLCWITVVRMGTLVVFLILQEMLQFFTTENNVCCRFIMLRYIPSMKFFYLYHNWLLYFWSDIFRNTLQVMGEIMVFRELLIYLLLNHCWFCKEDRKDKWQGLTFSTGFWSFVLSMHSKTPRNLSNNIPWVLGNFQLWTHVQFAFTYGSLMKTQLRDQPARGDSSFILQIPKYF